MAAAAEQPTPQRQRFLRAASTPSLHAAAPPLQHRWLHAADAKAAHWSAFGARDDRLLQRAWERSADERRQWADSAKGRDAAEQPAPPDPDRALESWRVPVAEDRLYEVDLRKLQVRSGSSRRERCKLGRRIADCEQCLVERLTLRTSVTTACVAASTAADASFVAAALARFLEGRTDACAPRHMVP